MAVPPATEARLTALAPRIRRVSWASLVWLAVEGAVAIIAGAGVDRDSGTRTWRGESC